MRGVVSPWHYDECVAGTSRGKARDAVGRQQVALDDAAAQIRAMPDPVAAFQAAGRLVGKQNEFRGQAARLRAEQVRRIWDEADGRMSLSQLGVKLRISKARAAELLKSAGPTATKDRAVVQPQPASERE